MVGEWEIVERLEMLLVLQWLDEGRDSEGAVSLSIATAALDLDLADGRDGMLEVMAALTSLEEARRAEVTWPRGPGAEAHVRLAEGIRTDAARIFGQ